MNDRPTPETDAEHAQFAMGGFTLDFCRKLERERDEAREALADWENAADHVEANHPDEVHCGCVPVLRKLLADARKERDEAREAAAKWESSFDAMERAGAEQARRADENREWALRAERERDEAREQLSAAKHFLEKYIAERDEARIAIISTLEENRHLADGDNCTLAKLKSVVPEWK